MSIGAYSISQFKSKLSGGGARANLFEVRMNLPSGLSWGGGKSAASSSASTGNNNEKASNTSSSAETFIFLCKAAALPASNVASIDVPFRGRTFKVAGDRTVDPWTITVINDEDFQLRRTFEQWVNSIATLESNVGSSNPSNYMASANVYQLGRSSASSGGKTDSNTNASSLTHSVLANYKFVDIFPTTVSQIDLSYDSSNTIEEFTVEFQVQNWSYVGTSLESTSSSSEEDEK